MSKENEYPKISIITVSYNAVATIEQTILSVINQTYENIEYIIIDGGSTDGTVNIIKKYEKKNIDWISESDSGIYNAMNKGVEMATGNYIQFLGADDALSEINVIEKVGKILLENQNIDILSGTVWTVDEKTHMQRIWDNCVDDKKIDEGYLINHQGMFTKRSVLKKYPFNEKYKIVSDYEFILKTYFDKDIKYKYISLPVAFYSMAGISATDNSRILEHIEVMKKFHLNEKNIEKYEKELIDKNMKINKIKEYFKNSIKNFLLKFKIWKFIQNRRGMIVHKCDMPQCRWCRNIDNIGEK